MFIILWHARKAYASNLITQGVDFEVVRPAGATHCMVRGEIWRVGFGSLLDVKLHSVGAGVSVGPETENFTPFRNINAPRWRIPCAIFTKLRISGQFHVLLNIKIWRDSLKWFRRYGV